MECCTAVVRATRVLLVVVALLGACNGGGGGRPDDTLPPRASTSTTVDYSVPAVIDVAYVEKVMEALDHVYGDAIRLLARERQITTDFLEHLAAIYTPSEFELVQQVWVRDVASGLRGLLAEPRDPETTVTRMLRAEPLCIVAAVDRRFAPTRDRPDPKTPQRYIGLIRKPEVQPHGELNPTPWVMSFDGFKQDGSEPATPCASE